MADDSSVELLKAVAHPSRLAILEALVQGERNVGEIEAVTGIGQPALSQQLSVLRKTGLVSARRQAKLVYYALDLETVARTVAPLAALLPDGLDKRSDAPRSMGMGGAAVFAQLD